MRVVVADDDRGNRDFLLALMESQGHTVVLAANGLQALDLVRAAPPDLIISDVLMPEMDGFLLCRVLKASEALRHIPLVFYTATYVNAGDGALGHALGAARYLLKPMEPRLFLNEINAVMAEAAKGILPSGAQHVRDGLSLAHAHQERISEKLDKKTRDVNRLNRERALILNAADEGIVGLDLQGRYTLVNTAAATMLGYPVDEMIGVPAHMLWHQCPIHATLERGDVHRSMEATWGRKDGSTMPVEYSSTPLLEDGTILGAVVVFRDISERKNSETRQQLAASVFTHAREGISITDPSGNIIDVNDMFTEITGYSRDEVVGKDSSFLQSGRQDQTFYIGMWQALTTLGHWSGEVWNRRKNGEEYAEILTISAVRDQHGDTLHYVALFSDITAIKDHQSQLEHIAHYDTLTGLPNRLLLGDRLQQAIAQSQRRKKTLAVAFLDLDNIKAVNDTYGHDAGDAVLIAVSNAMQDALREGDTLARMGGDEFVAVLVDLDHPNDCIPVIERLLAAAATAVKLPASAGLEESKSNKCVEVSTSIGVTFYPQDDVDGDLLLRHADQAMYLAKQAGKNCFHLFDIAKDAAIHSRHADLKRIRLALDCGEFVLYYQPKVNMRTGEVIGAEALIRWQHPQRGLLPPAAFLPITEGHPISIDVGEWVIDTALSQMSAWRTLGIDLAVSVNIGALQLQQKDFPARLGEVFAKHPDVKPQCLQLEILETSAMEDIGRVTAVMQACQAMGLCFALDDFGTGYSSLTYLKNLPAEILKIDQSFIRNMTKEPGDLAIVKGVIGLAEVFHRQVIAEGVETKALGDLLLGIGCELAQGYGIARPMPAKDFPAWVALWNEGAVWTG